MTPATDHIFRHKAYRIRDGPILDKPRNQVPPIPEIDQTKCLNLSVLIQQKLHGKQFCMKFDNYGREHHWSSQECKSNLMYILEGKAAEFFASVHAREPELPFYDIVRKLEARFAFRELQETSQLAFMNATQGKDEKVEDWADSVLTLATRAYKKLPDDHIQKQAMMRFCHGCYDKKAGMHAANKMLERIEEAIDCVRWYQYNQQMFSTESYPMMMSWSLTTLQPFWVISVIKVR